MVSAVVAVLLWKAQEKVHAGALAKETAPAGEAAEAEAHGSCKEEPMVRLSEISTATRKALAQESGGRRWARWSKNAETRTSQ